MKTQNNRWELPQLATVVGKHGENRSACYLTISEGDTGMRLPVTADVFWRFIGNTDVQVVDCDGLSYYGRAVMGGMAGWRKGSWLDKMRVSGGTC